MKKIILFAALATPIFFSCTKEMDPQAKETPAAKIAFNATIEDLNAPTKADINASNQLVWKAGDKIGVFVNDDSWGDGKHQSFVLVGDGGTTTGGFKWDVNPAQDFTNPNATIAFFPWQGTGASNNNVANGYMYFKYRDSYYGYTSGQMLTPLIAKLNYNGDAYDNISFKHAGAAVKVNVTNLPAYAHSLGLTIDGQQLNGSFKVDPASVTNELEIGTNILTNDGDPDNTKSSVWLNFEPSSSTRDFTFLFPVPKIEASSILKFYMYDKNGAMIWSGGTKAKGDVAINRGNVLVASLPEITNAYSSFDQISAWGVCGTHTGWADGSDTKMVTEVDGDVHIANDIVFAANAEFKIRKNGSWSAGEYGWTNLDGTDGFEEASGNIKVLNAGTYDIILNTSTHKIKVVASDIVYPDAGKMPHHTSIKKATNLGATETANCYVIKAAGNYKIPGVKGNSATTVGAIKGVELLWETYNNGTSVTANSVIAKVDYDETDNCVYFKTPDVLQYGNALIAAKDSEGNIIWSWHIWIPSSAITDIGEYAVSSKYYMDRNLGALTVATASTTVDVAAESFGMFYQWGRKDPFIGARAKGSGSLAKYTGTTQTGTSESVDMDYAIAHPTTMAKNNNWNDGITDRWGQGSSKTIYDPCPAGYRIPEYNSSEVLWQDVTSNGTFVVNGAHGWWKVGTSFIFPMAGDGGYDYAEHAFDRNKLWTAKQLDDSHPQHGLGQYIYYVNAAPENTWTSDEEGSWASVPSWGVRKRYFASVRCQKIEGEVLPPIPAGAKGVTLATDGTISTDWSKAEAIADSSDGIKEWKYGYDSSNLYFYFKIRRGAIKALDAAPYSYRTRRYIYFALDTDNDSSSGVTPSSGDYKESGFEVLGLVYPFDGNAETSGGTDGTLTIINGLDDRSYTKILSPESAKKTTEDDVYAYGNVQTDYVYVEISVPRADMGISSTFTGIMKVQFSLSSTLTSLARIELK